MLAHERRVNQLFEDRGSRKAISVKEKVIQSKALGHVDLRLWVQWGLATCRNARTELIKTSYSLQSMNPSETCAG